jgi:hypothetical protein
MAIAKIIGRTLVFLLAAVIVLAGVNALNSAGVLSSVPGGPPEGGFVPNSAAQTSTEAVANTAAISGTTMTPPNFERGEGDDDSEGFSLSGLTTVAKNLAQMSGLIVVVTLMTRAVKALGKRRTMAAGTP